MSNLQCSRCGARWAEEKSCGKSIHLDLPPMPRDEPTSSGWQAWIGSSTFSAERCDRDTIEAAFRLMGWKLEEPEDEEDQLWLIAIPEALASAIEDTGFDVVIPGTSVNVVV